MPRPAGPGAAGRTAPGPDLASVTEAAARHELEVLGHLSVAPQDGLPDDIRTILLLGPVGPGFWPHLTAQPEWRDGLPDPVDRWSRRVIGRMACDLGGKAYFPFTGPPWHPFQAWAIRSGRIWQSPVRLLVHGRAGLFVSFRGALGLRVRIAPPAPAVSPCASCVDRPCLSACPAGALTGAGYDVPACHGWLDTTSGNDCLTRGCAVRRACPAASPHARLPEQSAYHMRQFHR